MIRTANALITLGLLAVVLGIAWVSVPAGVIAGGIVMAAGGFVLALGGDRR